MKIKNISKVIQIVEEDGKVLRVRPKGIVEVSDRLGKALLDSDPRTWESKK